MEDRDLQLLQIRQCIKNIVCQSIDVPQRQMQISLTRELREIRSFHKLHHRVEASVVRQPVIDELDDVLVAECAQDSILVRSASNGHARYIP